MHLTKDDELARMNIQGKYQKKSKENSWNLDSCYKELIILQY